MSETSNIGGAPHKEESTEYIFLLFRLQTLFTPSITSGAKRWQFLINIDVRSMMSCWIYDTSNFSDRLVQIHLGVGVVHPTEATNPNDDRATCHEQAGPSSDTGGNCRRG